MFSLGLMIFSDISFTAKAGTAAFLLAGAVLLFIRRRALSDFLRVLYWTVGCGIVAFFAGFYGPLYIGPESPQGPLFGIFISGPLGAVIGAIIGLVLSIRAIRYRGGLKA